MIENLPILGICGWSGSGKTTLIERILPELRRKGLDVAVVKHDARGIDVDREGKDSDRLYRAGADVVLQGPDEEFLRAHRRGSSELTQTLAALAERYDLVLVEGHKEALLQKVWLCGEQDTVPPADVSDVAVVLDRDADRPAIVMNLLEDYLAAKWAGTTVHACVFIGGKSTRMGTPKHLLLDGEVTWLERTVELLRQVSAGVIISGAGDVPGPLEGYVRLPDAPDAQGPMAGLLAAMRWAPRASWLVAACDLPQLSRDALEWLLSTRAPGVWATVPRRAGSPGAEPLLAHYDFRCRAALEQLAGSGTFRLSDIAGHSKVISPQVPAHLADAWRNVNSPGS